MGKPRSGQATAKDPTADRYPSILKVLARLQDEVDWPEGGVDKVEVQCLATGQSTYHVWFARAEEPVSGYFAADTS